MTARNRLSVIAALVGLCFVVGACASYVAPKKERKDRGVRVNHALHAEQELECSTCHEPQENGSMGFPTHDLCAVCHEFDIEAPTAEACGLCHSRENYEVDPLESILGDEVIFSHGPHAAEDADCAKCHTAPDEARIASTNIMADCMSCHAQQPNPALNDCATCHKEITQDTIPQFRAGVRIPHDSPDIWLAVHGRESQADAAYCAMCHTQEETFCNECHAKTAPANHTLSFQRHTHGMQASWDRQSCAVCHEESSCMQCHQNKTPRSHTRAWGAPLNQHCVHCHNPPTDTGCAVCHESVDHPQAKISPHRVNIFPVNCARCHPGGLPNRAPHPMNSTVDCSFCH